MGGLAAAIPYIELGLKLIEAAVAAEKAEQIEKARQYAIEGNEALSRGLAALPEELRAIALKGHADVDKLYPVDASPAGGGT